MGQVPPGARDLVLRDGAEVVGIAQPLGAEEREGRDRAVRLGQGEGVLREVAIGIAGIAGKLDG
ncbi:MAG: hypothetical protein WDN01_07025 [Rhizomicrobium sp.]